MKHWLTIGLIVVGGYVAYKWYAAKQGMTNAGGPWLANASQSLTTAPPGSPISAPVDVAGIPEFNDMPVLNRPDQLFATMYSNPLSSVSGSPQYTPAFGPLENQGGTPTF